MCHLIPGFSQEVCKECGTKSLRWEVGGGDPGGVIDCCGGRDKLPSETHKSTLHAMRLFFGLVSRGNYRLSNKDITS